MPVKLASFSTIDHVCQCLLKNIESENAFSLGLFGDTQAPSWKSTQTPDPDELRACILETVDLVKHQLLERAAAVGRGRNSLLPLRRLPPEILSTCIGHAMTDIDIHSHQQRLTQLSNVSSWWHRVTLGTPSLWGVIHSKDPDWIVALALERSKDTPLTVRWETASYTGNLRGGMSYRDSIGAEDFFKLVSPHTNRWRDATLPKLGSGSTGIDWPGQHKVQLSRHHPRLSLCCDESPSTETALMGFSGLAEGLLELKLHNLHVYSEDIKRILAGSSQLVSLDLESLLALGERENEAMPENELNDSSRTSIDLPRLTKLSLKSLPWTILGPVVQNLNPSNMEAVSIVHHMGDNRDQETAPELLSSFTARLVALEDWVIVHPRSTNVTLSPLPDGDFPYNVELQGPPSVILPWLRLRSLPQITQQYFVELIISSEDLGDDPEQVLIENLLHFPNVGYVVLRGDRESWRWIWLLSQSDAVKTDPVGSEAVVKSWLWPELEYLEFNGDSINEFTILSVLLARHGPQSIRESTIKKKAGPRRLANLWVRPGKNVWRAEVLDRPRFTHTRP